MPAIHNKYSYSLTALLMLMLTVVKAQVVQYKFEGSAAEFSLPENANGISDDSLILIIQEKLHDQGFLYATSDIVDSGDSLIIVRVRPGSIIRWGNIALGSLPASIAREINLKALSAQPFSKSRLDSLYQEILDLSERQGYAFASVALDDLYFVEDRINATINYVPGPVVTYGNLTLDPQLVKPKFLQRYLLLNPDKPLNSQHIQQLPRMLTKLRFMELNQVPVVKYSKEKAEIELSLSKVQDNLIEAILGILPNENDGGVLITGQVDLELSNLFRSGKRLEFHWKSFRPQTQDLLLKYDHPALLGSALDLGLAFSILKQDTTFLNRRFQAGIATRSYGSNSYRFFGDINSSRSIDAGDEITNFNMNYIGAGIVVNKLDRPRFPLSGFLVALDAAVGLKSIKSASSDQGNSTQGKVDFGLKVYRPVGKAFQLFGYVAAGAILNNDLFINDAYRKGGLRSLRGFNENEFFATRYSTISVEFRTLLKGEGYLYTFYDQGFLLLDTVDRLNKDTPFGVGIGALLNAGAGKLNLAFAMGRSNVQPFSFDFSKLHFGYVVVF